MLFCAWTLGPIVQQALSVPVAVIVMILSRQLERKTTSRVEIQGQHPWEGKPEAIGNSLVSSLARNLPENKTV